jgi:phosphoglycerate dehydrogenase-like enzyme
MTFKVLNTLDMSGCPEALDVFEGIGTVDTLPAEYDVVSAAIETYDAYLPSLKVPVDAAMIARARKLKVIGTPSTGTDHLDLDAIRSAGITCFDISREYDLINSFTATSELAFGSLLALNRRICEARRAVLDGQWARERFTGFQLLGKTLGIVGLGRLGKISARIGNGFSMRVVGCDIRDVDVPDVAMMSFEQVVKEADVLTLHVHLRDDTRGMLSREAIGWMKPDAILLNTSRGALVDEMALLEALRENRIGGACLDVIDGEWLRDVREHPLVHYAQDHDNLLIVPHIGGATHESIYGARVFMARKVAEFLKANPK